jgi:hypothetical protein
MPGLKRLELSRRWCPEISIIKNGSSNDALERSLITWFRDTILLRHGQLVSASWAEIATQRYPNDGEDDFVWTKVTLTLSSEPASAAVSVTPSATTTQDGI